MKLIAGLGNPGKQYAETRHNAGFMAVDFLAKHFGMDPFKTVDRHKGALTEGVIGGEKVMLLKPMTFMNLSGESVQNALHFYKLSVADLIVIYDDVDVPLGKLKIRPDGSHAGHNGMRSIMECLGTQTVKRVRVGIQPEKPYPGKLEDYVLGRLSEDESVGLSEAIEQLPGALDVILSKGIETAMNHFN